MSRAVADDSWAGQATRDASKKSAARRWIAAVNAAPQWGQWSYHVAHSVADVQNALDEDLPRPSRRVRMGNSAFDP